MYSRYFCYKNVLCFHRDLFYFGVHWDINNGYHLRSRWTWKQKRLRCMFRHIYVSKPVPINDFDLVNGDFIVKYKYLTDFDNGLIVMSRRQGEKFSQIFTFSDLLRCSCSYFISAVVRGWKTHQLTACYFAVKTKPRFERRCDLFVVFF